ncbi:MAG: hydroxyacylglutathione hydrolase [Pseudomonadota bacterium]
MANLEIHQFPCLQDNYGVLIRDADTGDVASIDAATAKDVQAALTEKGWTLTHILTTHHHGDHTDGNLELKQATGCKIIGPSHEADKIPGIDQQVGDGETFKWGSFSVNVHHCPGHTNGHIIFHMPEASVAFVGDVLFPMGCGRVFEGSMDDMHAAVSKVAALPDNTVLYAGHEYTVANAEFAIRMEPGNAQLQARLEEVKSLRAAGKPTLPTRVDVEKATNPFIRPHSTEIRQTVGLPDATDAEVFAEVRERKNRG